MRLMRSTRPFVPWKAAPDIVKKAAIDLEDDLKMARQQQLETGKWPLFEGLRQQRMVGVRQMSAV